MIVSILCCRCSWPPKKVKLEPGRAKSTPLVEAVNCTMPASPAGTMQIIMVLDITAPSRSEYPPNLHHVLDELKSCPYTLKAMPPWTGPKQGASLSIMQGRVYRK